MIRSFLFCLLVRFFFISGLFRRSSENLVWKTEIVFLIVAQTATVEISDELKLDIFLRRTEDPCCQSFFPNSFMLICCFL